MMTDEYERGWEEGYMQGFQDHKIIQAQHSIRNTRELDAALEEAKRRGLIKGEEDVSGQSSLF